MATGLLHLHSMLRWVLLILLVITIFNAYTARKKNRAFSATDRKLSLFTMVSAHLQLVIGLMLYMVSPFMQGVRAIEGSMMADPLKRFWQMEHILVMVIGIVLITIGHIKAKKAASEDSRFKLQFTFFLIALVLIISRIPWPVTEMGVGRGWF